MSDDFKMNKTEIDSLIQVDLLRDKQNDKNIKINNDEPMSDKPNIEIDIPNNDKSMSYKHKNVKGDEQPNHEINTDKPTMLNQFWILVPFFLLHAGAGLAGGFTSVLLEHFQPHQKKTNMSEDHQVTCQQGNVTWMGMQLMGESSQCSHREGDASFLIVLATAEDYAPILVSILSGFLQQLVGPKQILHMTAIPAVLSWVLVLIDPQSPRLVILSRLMAGLATGLLSSNVYAAEISHRENRQPLKMIEGATRSAGAILIYVLQLIFWSYSQNIRWIAGISAIIPLLSFIGMFFRPESSVFIARDTIKRTTKKLEREKSNSKNTRKKNKQIRRMRIPPFGSPTIYKPLIVITFLICLQHCSGLAFTRKFLLQLLRPKNPTSDPRLATIFAIAITTIRLFANLFMARLIKTIRVRGLYFFSLFSTALCLIILGLFLDDCLNLSPITGKAKEYINVVLLALHIFLVQFGLQSLSGNLTDILFPTMFKPVMKGLKGAIFNLTLVIFLFVLTFYVNCNIKYSWTLWVMGSILLLSSPILWVIIPEVRNIGKKMAMEFYQPNQTIFFFIIQKKGRNKEIENVLDTEIKHMPSNRFRSAVEKMIESNRRTKKVIATPKLFHSLSQLGTNIHQVSRLIAHQESLLENATNAQTATFEAEFETIEEMMNDKLGRDDNNERVSFIHNIHPQTGYLQRNKNHERVLIGKGPINFDDNLVLNRGGVFLFNDVLIISQCVRNNMRYVKETYFHLNDQTFQITRVETKINFHNSIKSILVTFEEVTEAKTWEKYVRFYKDDKSKSTCAT